MRVLTLAVLCALPLLGYAKEPVIDGTWRVPTELFGKSDFARLKFSRGRVILSVMDMGKTRSNPDWYMTGRYTLKDGILKIDFTDVQLDLRRLTADERARVDQKSFGATRAKMLQKPFPTSRVHSVDSKRLLLVDPSGKGRRLTFTRES